MKIEKSFSKCWGCIKDGTALEQEVLYFPTLAICLCEKHLNEIVKDYFELDYVMELKEVDDADSN